jgi:hypothetical protein
VGQDAASERHHCRNTNVTCHLKKEMTRLISTVTLLLVLFSCDSKRTKLEGVWILVYELTGNNPEPVYVRTLMDFSNDSVNMISVGDLSTGDLSKIQIEKSQFKLDKNESVIAFAGGQFKLSYSTDSLILQSDDSSKFVFKRLNPKLKIDGPTINCFSGAYTIVGEKYRDSICFINDSTLIHTGNNKMNFPAKKWNIVTYKGFQFLNIQDSFDPLTVIKSCTPDKVTLVYNYQKELEFVMKPIRDSFSREKLIGRWTEIYSNLKPPTPPHLEERDQYYDFTIDQDSVQIKYWGRNKKLKWNITADGKRIYFEDKIFEEDGSWKLMQLTDSAMTLRISKYSGFEEEIIKLKRDSNGR